MWSILSARYLANGSQWATERPSMTAMGPRHNNRPLRQLEQLHFLGFCWCGGGSGERIQAAASNACLQAQPWPVQSSLLSLEAAAREASGGKRKKAALGGNPHHAGFFLLHLSSRLYQWQSGNSSRLKPALQAGMRSGILKGSWGNTERNDNGGESELSLTTNVIIRGFLVVKCWWQWRAEVGWCPGANSWIVCPPLCMPPLQPQYAPGPSSGTPLAASSLPPPPVHFSWARRTRGTSNKIWNSLIVWHHEIC